MKYWQKLESLHNQIQSHIDENLAGICKDFQSKKQALSKRPNISKLLFPILSSESLTKSKMSSFLETILLITNERPSTFDKYMLKILLFIFEKNEFFILRDNSNMKLYLKILKSLKSCFVYLQEDDIEHIVGVIKGVNPYGIGEEEQEISIISSLILTLVKDFSSVTKEEFPLKFFLRHFKNIFNSRDFNFDSDFDSDGVDFWMHKLIEKEESCDFIVDFVVNKPKFLLKFDIKNVRDH